MQSNEGFDEFLKQPLFDTIWRRRTHRVSRGVTEVAAGSMTYKSTQSPLPLGEAEEAVLIAMTGCTGLTMPDRPFFDPATGAAIMAKPNLTMDGRTAGSPDNAQATHFFLINDEGTYFLRTLPSAPDVPLTLPNLIERARQAKVRLLDRRLDVPAGQRDFPAYLDSNRFLSNLPGTTMLLPVVDLSHQYINGLMYVLTQPDGARPTLVDDRNFYFTAGVKKWVRSSFLNKDLKVPLGILGALRTPIEADLLLQNLFLTADAMGLGAWIHATIAPPVMLGDPRYADQYGKMLGFEYHTPAWRFRPLDLLRWGIVLPRHAHLRAQPVALKHEGEYLIKAACPPNYESMAAAVTEVARRKFGDGGVYRDADTFRRIYKEDYGERYLRESGDYTQEVIDCARAVCEYIYGTHGRFPAHVDAIHVPGVWLQVHHVDLEYYDRFFNNGLTEAQRRHHARWHAAVPRP